MKELLEQGLGTLIVGTVAATGVIIRLLLLGYYGTLSRACKRFESTKHKTIAYIKADLKQRAEQGQEIRNAMTYTECRLAEGKVAVFRVGGLESVMQYSVLLVVLSGILIALAGALTECGDKFVLHVLFLCGAAVGIFVLVDLLTGIREKDRRIRLCIRDYIENNQIADMERMGTKAGEPEEKKQSRKERRAEKRAEKRSRREERKAAKSAEKRQKADKPVQATKKKNGKAQEEKRRLTEELLRERRQLEARSLAEQRKKEREEEPVQAEETPAECPVQQVQAEAAVTECPEHVVQEEDVQVQATKSSVAEESSEGKSQEFSYEMLLSEVLAEYLA